MQEAIAARSCQRAADTAESEAQRAEAALADRTAAAVAAARKAADAAADAQAAEQRGDGDAAGRLAAEASRLQREAQVGP